MDGSERWTLTGIDPRPDRVSYLRHQAALALQVWGADELRWIVEQLLTELAGNAVRHALTPFDVTMAWDRNTLRVEVSDANPKAPQPRPHVSDNDVAGRGLLLVDKIATRWGSEPHAAGKVVWFEATPAAPETEREHNRR